MPSYYFRIICLFFLPLLLACQAPAKPAIEVSKWQKLSLSFVGPESAESAEKNPFTDYRLWVSFSKGDKTYVIPGFYAADGNAAETSAEAGNVWQVRFRPDEEGIWTYVASFREAENIAISDDATAGTPTAFDGETGQISVLPPQPGEEGRLLRGETRYLHYAESGRAFLKGGADSPENFLGYADFDGTYKGKAPEDRKGEARAQDDLHTYSPHEKDWQTGDLSWQNGKGKGMVGALNYLASKGMNSVYFLTLNIEGDGKDVWPYTGYEVRDRFDCSKLDQWELVFDYMDELGLMLHIVTQETENEKLLDEGDTGFQRKLYYRELIARFAHHKAITWNMGEENGPANFSPNGQSLEQQKAMVAYIKTHDPYQNMIVIHSHADKKLRYEMFDRLLDDPYLDGISIQAANRKDVHQDTKDWIAKSAELGRPWVVCIDEIGHYSRGVDNDDRPDNNQDSVRAEVLWGNLMSGGGGAEWYFGYLNPENDLGCEDWRSRENVWNYTQHALDFFHSYLPFEEMYPADERFSGDEAYCFAKTGELYAVYLLAGGTGMLDLSEHKGSFQVSWYDPRTGGALQRGSVVEIRGGGLAELGNPPSSPDKDWAVLVQKK
ncbi:MAG: DUF5060 domain-containing protein [Bacteroidota bacterium]